MGLLSFLKGISSLGGAQGTRMSMAHSYQEHRKQLEQHPNRLPPGTSTHDAALYGTLATRYRTLGTKEDAIHRMEPFLWLELLPFTHTPEQMGAEALAEYVVWKEPETRGEARVEWLREAIQRGVAEAKRSGREDDLNAALGKVFKGASPWAVLFNQ